MSIHIIFSSDISDFLFVNNSPQVSGRNAAVYFNLVGCAQVSCTLAINQVPTIDCELDYTNLIFKIKTMLYEKFIIV